MEEQVEGLFGVMEVERSQQKDSSSREVGPPRYKPIDRQQLTLKTIDIERLVEADDPVRGIWEMTGQLDYSGFEGKIRAREGTAGQRTLSPRLLTSLWIYALSQGVTSARELSRMIETDRGCQWLTALETINHHTLSDFRVDHQSALEKMFVEVVGLMSAENLIEMKRVAQDGTKIRANAGTDTFRREERIRQHLQLAQQQIEELNKQEQEEISERVAAARLRGQRETNARLQQALEELKNIRQTKSKPEEARASETDPQARVMKQSDGGWAPSYNVQLTTDSVAGAIIAVDVTQSANDYDSLAPALKNVAQSFGKKPEQVLTDSGYICRENIVRTKAEGIDLIGPVPEMLASAGTQKRQRVAEEFQPQAFQFDKTQNCFICPAGKTLLLRTTDQRTGMTLYTYQAKRIDCTNCCFKSQCISKGDGPRSIVRTVNSDTVQAFIAKMESTEAKQIYKERSQLSEFANCWIKAKCGLRQFRLRGLIKVRMESLWAALTFNVQMWVRLVWRHCEGSA